MKNSVFKVLGLGIFLGGVLCSAMLTTSEPETSVHYNPDDCRCYHDPGSWQFERNAENVWDKDGQIIWGMCELCDGPIGPDPTP